MKELSLYTTIISWR